MDKNGLVIALKNNLALQHPGANIIQPKTPHKINNNILAKNKLLNLTKLRHKYTPN
jgi:hypothetical protein